SFGAGAAADRRRTIAPEGIPGALSFESLRSPIPMAIASTSASACRRASAGARALFVVLVVAAPPEPRLVASFGGAIEPLVHAPEAVQSARIGGIRVVDDAVLEHERAHARPLARERGHVGSSHGRERGSPLAAPFLDHRWFAPVVVLDTFFALLLLGESDAEVEVEVAAEGRRPGERPPQAPLVRLQLRERRPRHRA